MGFTNPPLGRPCLSLPHSLHSETKAARNDVGYGPWLCENAKTLNDDRRSYSSEIIHGLETAIAFDLKTAMKNIIPVAFGFFAFPHSQGQKAT
jgi:hypothetical protein